MDWFNFRNTSPARRRQSRSWRRRMGQAFTPLGLATLIGSTGTLWLTEALIMPKLAYAYTARLELFLTRDRNESYETLIRRAELAARTGAQRSFDQDLLISEVNITVTAESEGVAVPLLTLSVDRNQWRNYPETRYWATYYRMARAFLENPEQ
jgi:hypothetical protein